MKLLLFLVFVISLADDDVSEEETEQLDSREMQMFEQTQWACVLLMKHQLNKNSDVLLSTVKSYSTQQDQKKVYDKIQAIHVLQCMERMNNQLISDLSHQLRHQTFKIEDFQDVFMMIDIPYYKSGGAEFELSDEDKMIIKYIQDFDKKMEEQRRKNRQESGGDDDKDEEDEEYKPFVNQQMKYQVFGFDINTSSNQTKLVILIAFSAILGIFFYVGLKMVKQNTQPPAKKAKKQKKQN